jgi:hypothetical protein
MITICSGCKKACQTLFAKNFYTEEWVVNEDQTKCPALEEFSKLYKEGGESLGILLPFEVIENVNKLNVKKYNKRYNQQNKFYTCIWGEDKIS